jgi:3-dehydroquinate synthase
MKRVQLSIPARSSECEVVIGSGLASVAADRTSLLRATSALIVSDSNVGPLYAHRFAAAMSCPSLELSVPAGEQHKNQDALRGLYDRALAWDKLDRSTVVVALGGGMPSDLAGLLAATLLRGLRWMVVPTSLLAMVDAAIGGKTAINHATGRNRIGAFHQPAAVFCDLGLLDSLPDREYLSAFAEVIKTAALGAPGLLELLERDCDALRARDPDILARVIESCVHFKADVVARDEREQGGVREQLNLGHTLAHAIEHVHMGRYLHGEAVAVGLAAALRLSVERAGLDGEVASRMTSLLARFSLPFAPLPGANRAAVQVALAGDKKRRGRELRFVVLRAIGKPEILKVQVDEHLVNSLLGDAP